MILLIVLINFLILLIILNFNSLKEIKKLSSDKALDDVVKNLPSNDEICYKLQEIVGSKCDVELDDNTKSSAYIFFKNKIILSNNNESKNNFSRILFIAHECIHSIQSKRDHIINFVFANIKNVFDIFLLIYLILGKGSFELIMISFMISFFSFYFRMQLEVDAVYRSVTLSRKYLSKFNLENIADKYEDIVSKTVNGMYYAYTMPTIIKTIIMLVILFIRSKL